MVDPASRRLQSKDVRCAAQGPRAVLFRREGSRWAADGRGGDSSEVSIGWRKSSGVSARWYLDTAILRRFSLGTVLEGKNKH